MANAIEILLTARSNVGGAFRDASAQTALLRGELSSLSPVAGGVIGQVEGLAGAFSGLGSGISAFIGISAIAGAALVGLGTAAFGAASKLAAHALQLERVSRQTGASIPDIQVLQESLEHLGVPTEAAGNALFYLSKQIGAANPLLKQLGIVTKDPYQAFVQLMGVMKDWSPADRARVGVELMSRSFRELSGSVPELLSMMREVRAEMEQKGLILDPDKLLAADRFRADVRDLKETWEGWWTYAAARSASGISQVLDAMEGKRTSERLVESIKEQISAINQGLASGQYWGEGVDSAKAEVSALEVRLANINRDVASHRHDAGGFSAAVPAPAATDANATAAANERAKAILKIADGLRATGVESGLANDEAAKFYATLKQYELLKFGESVTEQVNKAAQALQDAHLGVQAWTLTPEQLGLKQKEIARGETPLPRLYGGLAEIKPMTQPQFDRKKMAEDLALYHRQMVDMLSMTNVVKAGLGALYIGIQNGFADTFNRLIRGTMALKDALNTIWQDIVNNIIGQLATLVASWVFNMLLGFLTGGASIPMSAFSGIIGATAGPALMPRGGSFAMAPAGITNYNTIQTFSPRDVLMQYTSPRGVLRVAQNRLTAAGAY